MRIIRITALWCTSCLIMKKRWDKVFSEYKDIEIIDYDFDEDKEKALSYNPGKILPVLIIEQNGKEVNRLIGEMSKKQLARRIGEIVDEEI